MNFFNYFIFRVETFFDRLHWVLEIMIVLFIPIGVLQPQSIEVLGVCLALSALILVVLWIKRMVLRLFEKAVRLYRLGLMAVNNGVEQLWLFASRARNCWLEFWSTAYVLVFVLLDFLSYAYVIFSDWREENKVLHRTIYVGVWSFSLFFLYEVVPPYDDPRACFTMRFFYRLEMWVVWICKRIVRWFILSGF